MEVAPTTFQVQVIMEMEVNLLKGTAEVTKAIDSLSLAEMVEIVKPQRSKISISDVHPTETQAEIASSVLLSF